ncbi:MAG: iron-sulfur cluster assembly protein [Actinomycetota bacterium]|nr:iron-sulfur cluster assembly protein [Actinomycetota bacterium]
MTTALASTLEARVRDAVATVDDPEYPGVSIVDLGLFEALLVTGDGTVEVRLVPTFSGCPALGMIADEVRTAVATVDGVQRVEVRWLGAPVWTVDRISEAGREALAREFTVAVRIGRKPVACPRCGAETCEDSLFGPSRCRAVHLCPSCTEVVEVMRSGA